MVNLHIKSKKYLSEIIPGHLYSDKDGKQFIFLGYGRYDREIEVDGKFVSSNPLTQHPNLFIYMKWEVYKELVDTGQLDPNFSSLEFTNKQDKWHNKFFMVFTPKRFVSDDGIVCDEHCLKNMRLKDFSHIDIMYHTFKLVDIP